MSKYKIKVLDDSHIFEERENGIMHTPYEYEEAFMSSVKKGSRTNVKQMIDSVMYND